TRRTQNVPGVMRTNEKLRAEPAFPEPWHRRKSLERVHHLVLRIERQGRHMRTVAVLCGVFGIFFHEVRRIRKQQPAEFLRRGIGEDRPAKTATYEARKIAGVS